MQQIKKIGVLTGGGDCSGLNAVIRAVTKTAILKYGWEVVGFKRGYAGLYSNDFVNLTLESTADILSLGGTILKNSNKDNLFNYSVKNADGTISKIDVSDKAVENLKAHNIDALIIIGGDGTLTSARDFARKGVNVVGVPKTIDNDVPGTEVTFGYSTSLSMITNALDSIHTTAASHDRIILVEVMGRNAGWLALEGGIAGAADVILLPEIPYSVEKVAEKIKQNDAIGRNYSIVVVSEGAKAQGGDVVIKRIVEGSPDAIRLGGAAEQLSEILDRIVENHEVRSTNLGYIQRGGTTNQYDRVLGTRLGSHAVDTVFKGQFGNMVCINDGKLDIISIEKVVGSGETGETSRGGGKMVDKDHELVRIAKSIGISFGD